MRKIAIGLLAGAGALLTGSANASDIYTSSEYTNSDLIQQVRMVCDDNGRCYRTRGSSRVIVRDSYAYAPRERYIEHRRYRDWDEAASRRRHPRTRRERGRRCRRRALVNNQEKPGERLRLGLKSLRRRSEYFSCLNISLARGNGGRRILLAGEATAKRRG